MLASFLLLHAPTPTPWLTDAHGAFLAQLGHNAEYGYWTEAPPARVILATLALEDRHFWYHPGVDPAAVLRALWRGHSGASTIAMQVARLQHPRPRTLWAKAIEAVTALALTARYGRAAVLTQYLRLAPYGNGSHGIAHAAQYYFSRPSADLSWAQIALLAALPQAPTLLNPLHPAGLARAIRRGQRVLDALAAEGVLTPAEASLARAELACIHLAPPPRRPDALAAIQRLAAIIPADRGPKLRTHLDLPLQDAVTRRLRDHLASWRGAGAQQIAAMVLRRRDHAVLVEIGAANPNLPGGAIDFTRTPRSPGSTLKPFLYALALERGVLSPDEVLFDRPEGSSGISNADGGYLGPLLPRQALANSRNVPAANLLRRVGLATAFDRLRVLGLHDLEGPADRFGLAMAIGALPTTLERLVRAYAALADGGALSDLRWFADGTLSPATRVLTEDSARLVTQFLSDPMARLPSFPRYGESEFPFAVALKTGTSQGYRDAWIIAWSAEYLIGVWVGRADDGPMHGVSGARAAGSLAQEILLDLHHATRGDLTAGGFAPPPGRVAAEICTRTGAPAAGRCAERLTEYLPAAPAPPPQAADPEVHLSILTPEPNTRIWRNPEAPAAANRLVLKAASQPAVAQIVWLVDGTAVATADPHAPFYWPLAPGTHRFQIRLPFAAVLSPTVRVVVE